MTLETIKAELVTSNPTLRRGNDEDGYEEVTGKDYENIINDWAKSLYDKELEAQAEAEASAKRSAALAKLQALGLDQDDLKALGL